MKTSKKTINLVYVGQRFYTDSSSSLSSIYDEDFNRYDYGFLQRDLALGHNVTIRQATGLEIDYMDQKLQEHQKRWAEIREKARQNG